MMKNRNLPLHLIVRLLLVTVLLGSLTAELGNKAVYASGNVYYVSTNGSDSNPGTESAPWRTIQKAARTVTAGDTVLVRGGIYNNGIIFPKNSGAQGRPITYRAYPGEQPVIDGTGFDHVSKCGLFSTTKQAYLILDGFEIKNALGSNLVYGVYNDGNNNTYKNLKIHTTNGGGIQAYGSNLLIENCEIFDNCLTRINESVSISNVNGFEIRNCILYGSTKNGPTVKDGSRNGLIHGNAIYGNATTGLYLDAHGKDIDNIKIYNNIFFSNNAAAIVLGSEVSPWNSVTNVDVYNNLIYNNYQGFVVYPYPFTRNFRIYNNVFYNNGAGIMIYGSAASNNAGTNLDCIIRNNIIINKGTARRLVHVGDPLAMGIPIIENNLYFNSEGVYNFSAGLNGGDNQIRANPLFVNPDALDFRLQSNSPAIDRGTSAGAPLNDYAGNPRPAGSGIDIGAFEYVNPNRPPVLNPIGNKTVNSGSVLTLVVTATDPDGDSLIYSASNLPPGASFNPLTGTFSWTPSGVQTGVFSGLRFTVTDGFLTDSQEINITVGSGNRAPVLSAIGNRTVNAGTLLTFSLDARDEDNDVLTYSAFNLPPGAVFDPQTRVFGWKPDYNQSGSFSNIRFTVSDGTHTETQTILITVNGVNRAPSLNPIGNKAAVSSTELTFVISASDENDDPLTYTASNLPQGATFNSQTRTFRWTPTSSQTGSFSNIRFAVSDGRLSVQEDITIIVNGSNRAPKLNPISSKNVDEGSTLTFVVTATDADNDNLTYSASNLPGGATFNPATRTFSWTPNNKQAGTYPNIHFSVTDGKVTVFEDITITVKDKNSVPKINTIGDRSGEQGTLLSFVVSAVDEDEDTLTYTASNLPAGATFNGATQTFAWTPTFNQSGTFSRVRFTVSDGKSTAFEEITLTVKKGNRAPVMSPIGNKTVNEGATLALVVSASDPDNDALTYAASLLPEGARFNPSTRNFNWTPTYHQAGIYSGIRFTVSDGKLTDSKEITITVRNVNRAPVLHAIGDKSVNAGQLLTFTVNASDPDDDKLTFTTSNLPEGAVFDSAGRFFTWTPTESQIGIHRNLYFMVSDGTLSDTRIIRITVNAAQPGTGVEITQTETRAITEPVTLAEDGTLDQDLEITFEDGLNLLQMRRGTLAQTAEGQPLTSVMITRIENTALYADNQYVLIGAVYDIGPTNFMLDQPVTVTFSYNTSTFPEGTRIEDIKIGRWDAAGQKWIELPASIDTDRRVARINTTQFAVYGLIAVKPEQGNQTPGPVSTVESTNNSSTMSDEIVISSSLQPQGAESEPVAEFSLSLLLKIVVGMMAVISVMAAVILLIRRRMLHNMK